MKTIVCSLIPLKKSSIKYFNEFVVIFIISNIREGQGVNAQNYVFLFKSIAKVFPSEPRYDNVTLIPLVLQLGLRISPIQRMGAN